MADRDEKGRFLKGNGSTRRGSPNKAKKALEERVIELVEGNIGRVKADLKKLSSRDRVRVITDLMKFVLPAKRAVDSMINIENLTDDQLDRVINDILEKQKHYEDQ